MLKLLFTLLNMLSEFGGKKKELWENVYLLVGFHANTNRKVGVQKRPVFSPG